MDIRGLEGEREVEELYGAVPYTTTLYKSWPIRVELCAVSRGRSLSIMLISGRVEEAVWHVSDLMNEQRYARWGDSPGDLHIQGGHGVGVPQAISTPIINEQSLKDDTPRLPTVIPSLSSGTFPAQPDVGDNQCTLEIDRSGFNFSRSDPVFSETGGLIRGGRQISLSRMASVGRSRVPESFS